MAKQQPKKKAAKVDLVSDRIGHTKKALLEAMRKSLGIVTKACKMVDVSRDTFYNYYNQDEEFKRQIDDIENIAIDFAESALFQIMEDGNPAGIIFYLKTKGKNRGYQERVAMEHSGTMKTEQHVLDYSKFSDGDIDKLIEELNKDA